jgi:hypothetical protein
VNGEVVAAGGQSRVGEEKKSQIQTSETRILITVENPLALPSKTSKEHYAKKASGLVFRGLIENSELVQLLGSSIQL